jgi:hypothetical protein
MSQFRGVTIDGVLNGYWIYWQTCTHLPELKVITSPLLISTLYKSQQYPLSLFLVCCVFNSRFLATISNNVNSSAPRAHIATVGWISRNWNLSTVNTTTNIAPSFLILTCRARLNCQPSTDNWQLNSLTHQPTTSLHFTQINWIGELNCFQEYSSARTP